MSNRFDFSYAFHPAGQGIFASGEVGGENLPLFKWVFDCGSTAPVTVLRPAVHNYRALNRGGYLDLLCISHFDKDHVSGLGDLLRDLNVDTVVIPYWSPIERLVAITGDTNSDPEYIDFLGNPVAFIITRARSVKQIVVISGTGDSISPEGLIDSPPSVEPGNRSDRENRPESEWKLMFKDETETSNWWATTETRQFAADRQVTLRTMALNAICELKINSLGSWEFCFFHKPTDVTTIQEIRTMLDELTRKGILPLNVDIISILSHAERRSAIREIYASRLRRAGESVNSASLCVYAGPQLTSLVRSEVRGPFPFPTSPSSTWSGSTTWSSILYTGDANFLKAGNRTELIDFLTADRWNKIAVLQVPHHGSRRNWEVGSASGFPHAFSVFCTDGTYGHPHAEVMRDLLQHGPIFANRSNGWFWMGEAEFTSVRNIVSNAMI